MCVRVVRVCTHLLGPQVSCVTSNSGVSLHVPYRSGAEVFAVALRRKNVARSQARCEAIATTSACVMTEVKGVTVVVAAPTGSAAVTRAAAPLEATPPSDSVAAPSMAGGNTHTPRPSPSPAAQSSSRRHRQRGPASQPGRGGGGSTHPTAQVLGRINMHRSTCDLGGSKGTQRQTRQQHTENR
jgi:hypothetical protein